MSVISYPKHKNSRAKFCVGNKNPKEDKFMPLVNVKVLEGVFSDSQKREMVKKLTDVMVSIEGENMRKVTWVVIEEVKSGDWGVGGTPLTTEDVMAMSTGKQAA
jgi:4-oxalocrotonate tautomerase